MVEPLKAMCKPLFKPMGASGVRVRTTLAEFKPKYAQYFGRLIKNQPKIRRFGFFWHIILHILRKNGSPIALVE